MHKYSWRAFRQMCTHSNTIYNTNSEKGRTYSSIFFLLKFQSKNLGTKCTNNALFLCCVLTNFVIFITQVFEYIAKTHSSKSTSRKSRNYTLQRNKGKSGERTKKQFFKVHPYTLIRQPGHAI